LIQRKKRHWIQQEGSLLGKTFFEHRDIKEMLPQKKRGKHAEKSFEQNRLSSEKSLKTE